MALEHKYMNMYTHKNLFFGQSFTTITIRLINTFCNINISCIQDMFAPSLTSNDLSVPYLALLRYQITAAMWEHIPITLSPALHVQYQESTVLSL